MTPTHPTKINYRNHITNENMLRHNICSGIARKKCYSYQKKHKPALLRVCISIRASKGMEGAWNLFLPGKQNLLHPPPRGKLSRSRQYRVNQFKLFKSMYPWFWSLSLISLSFFIFLSVLYLSIYLSVQNILFVKTNILHVFFQTNILFVRWNTYFIRTSLFLPKK